MISATKWLPLRIPLALVPSRAASIQQVASSRTSAAIAPARTRPKREGARGGRGAEKVGRAVGRGHAAARARQGAHGRAGHGEGARDRCRLRPDAIAPRPGRFRRLTRGRRRGRPTRGRRGRATRRRSCGARPPEARPGAAEPRARLGGRHAARPGPKRWLCARAAPALAERSVAQGF